jgi:hypothetical protein
MRLTELERAVLSWFAANAGSDRLRVRLRHIAAVERRSGRGGVFLTLRVPDLPLSGEERREANPHPGPVIRTKSIPGGAEGVLYVTEDEIPEALELFTYGDPWPAEVGDFELIQPGCASAAGEPRRTRG